MPKPKADHPFKKRKPSDVARRGGFSGAQNTCAADQAARNDPSTPTPQVQNSPGKKLALARNAVAIVVRLAEEFPRCFSVYERRRRPLKVGIDRDVLAATSTLTPDELKIGLRHYVGAFGYLAAMRAGVERVGLDGDPAGIVTAEAAALAVERIAEMKARRKSKPAPARAPTSRLSIDDLRAAARRRKQEAST